jgi:hypothetical protein
VAFAGLERGGCEIPFSEKADGKAGQSERSFLPGDYDLELLDLLVGGSMQGGGAEEANIVGQVQRTHQVVQIPIGGRDPLIGELHRDDSVKTFAEPFYPPFFLEAFEGFADGCRGNGQRALHLRAIKAIKAFPLEVIEEVRNSLIVAQYVLTYVEKDGFRPFSDFPALLRRVTAPLWWAPNATILHRSS